MSGRGRIFLLFVQSSTTWWSNFYVIFPEVRLDHAVDTYYNLVNKVWFTMNLIFPVDLSFVQSNALTWAVGTVKIWAGSAEEVGSE